MNELIAESIPVLGRALVHFIWQGGVVGLLAGIALFLLRHARPQSRYLVLCMAMLACLLAPLIDVALQLSDAGAASTPLRPTPTGRSPGPALQAAVFPAAAWAGTHEGWLPMVVAAWAAGACALCLRMALGVAWIGHLRASAQPPLQAQWQARLDAIARHLGIGRAVGLRLVDGMESPASAGWWRPVVLLPTALVSRMPVELVEALLAHELAHVRRHDYLVNLLQGLVEALLFYHPVVWWLSRQARVEREHIADRIALDALESPRTLAVALAALSELQSADRAPPRLAQAAQGGHLMSRIEQLVRPGRRVAGARIAFPLLGIATACLAFYAHARIAGAPAPAPKDAGPHVALPTPSPSPRPAPDPRPAPRAGGVLGMPVARATATANANGVATASVSVNGIVDVGSDEHRDAYALVRRNQPGITLSGPAAAARAVEALRGGMDSDFLWVRRDGREYVITDAALVARAGRAWEGSESLSGEMQALAARMEPHREKMRALGEQMGELGARAHPNPVMGDAQRRIGELSRRQARLAAEQARRSTHIAARGDLTEAAIEQRMEAMEARIEAEMESVEAQIEREAERIEAEAERTARRSAPMEALARRMEQAARPMEAIGERMEALGERHARLAEQADRETQAIIRDAIERGLARPAASSRQ